MPVKDPDLETHHLGVIVTKQVMREVEKSAKANYRTASMQARLVIELWLREAYGIKLKTTPCKPIYEDIKINWSQLNAYE